MELLLVAISMWCDNQLMLHEIWQCKKEMIECAKKEKLTECARVQAEKKKDD